MGKSRELHGLYRRAEYNVWLQMIQRCENPRKSRYDRYGARGIKVDPRWRQSFKAFLDDMGDRPLGGFTLERIDNDGDYTASNCRWDTRLAQSRNQQRTRRTVVNGEIVTLAALQDSTGIHRRTIEDRLKRGMPVAQAITIPAGRAPVTGKTSRFLGVSWDKQRSKWFAFIRCDGRMRNLGRYSTEDEAFEARRRAEAEYPREVKG